ncbi:MAG TPA: hypothetical protein VG370_18410 [Chloroflexota bacterium]|nr:hypothetical protein [Chloroflexota bacterium]
MRRLLPFLVGALLLEAAAPTATAAPTPQPPVVPASNAIGVADAFLKSELAWNAGTRWQRILFYWDAIQPEWNDQLLPNRHVSDAIIRNELARGFELVGVIGNPPRWATGQGSVPRNLDLPLDHPENNWARFTRRLASGYAGRIDTWIVWNEPDIRPGQAGSTWNGTPADYWLLLKTAAKAIRQANPKAKIGFAGTTFWADAGQGDRLFLERVLEVAARDPEAAPNGFFFDFVPFHTYSSPYKMLDVAATYRRALGKFGLARPLWLAETNVVPHDDPHADVPRASARGTLEEQASFVIQTVALARAGGVERVQFYKMMDGPIEAGEPYGLVRNDGEVRPAYVALQTAARHLLVPGAVSYRRVDGVARVVIDQGRRRTTVVWATGPRPTPARLGPVGTSALAYDKYGLERSLPLPAESPYYDLTLAAATANTAADPGDFIIGGDPVIVVEDGVGDPIEVPPHPQAGPRRFFPITGFRIEGKRLDYFDRRGGLNAFGYPVSRPFRLLGHRVQLFQRQALEERSDGSIGTLNVLDEEFVPYTRFNGAVIPAIDRELLEDAPTPASSGYATAVLRWIDRVAPDDWEDAPVRFNRVFRNTVRYETAFPDGRGDRALVPGLNLELWGLPTSRPARDPANHDFVYQRFQRGVMHFDRATGATQGLLLAAYLKAILTGEELPADLEADARGGRLYRQYDPAAPKGLLRPADLPDSDLTDAFERQAPR